MSSPRPTSTSASSGRPASRAEPVGRAALALLVAWTAWNLGAELVEVGREVRRPPNPGAVAEWRLTTPREEGLEGFLRLMDRSLPWDRRVAFTARSGNPDQEFFLTLWASYHLPRQRVVRLLPDLDLAAVDYVVTYNSELEDPRLREVARDFSGVLYRVEGGGPLGEPGTGNGRASGPVDTGATDPDAGAPGAPGP